VEKYFGSFKNPGGGEAFGERPIVTPL